MMAITASVILAIGLIPPYFELAKRNGRVIGISKTTKIHVLYWRLNAVDFIFIAIDMAGALFSLMALGKSLSTHFSFVSQTLTHDISCPTYLRRSRWISLHS